MIDQRIKRGFTEVVEPIEHRRRRQEMQIVAAFRQQAIDQRGVDAVGREHRLGDALRRILVEVEPRRAKPRSRSRDDGVHLQFGGEMPGDVGNRRGADAALGADHSDHAAERLGAGS